MDRPDETSESSAAPSLASFGNREASPRNGTPAVESDPAILEPAVLPSAPISHGVTAGRFDRRPPRPLPARAFGDATSTSLLIKPAILDAVTAPKLPELPVAEITIDPPVEPPSVVSLDRAFSEIEAEASSRSLSAVEMAIAGALREIKPHKPIEISELKLPDGLPSRNDLGETVPQRMLEPRLWGPPPPPVFDSLVIEPSMRHDLPRIENKPYTSTDRGSLVKRTGMVLAWSVATWLALVLLLILAYRFINPPASALMVQQWLTGQSVAQKWVPIEDMSPNIVRAVLLSEDGRFCEHFGVDLEAMEDAIENSDGRSRGGSTISMQVVKNLFLWPSKSYLRKAIELPLTYLMEFVWPKRRILEVYLNIAQWGPGVFGIATAANFHFRKSARSLSVREAAQLAVALPNPLTRNAGKPGPGLQRLANAIQVRMRLAPYGQLSCVLPRRRF